MYVPKSFVPRNEAQLVAHMRDNGFATLITHDDAGGIQAMHLPVTVRVVESGADGASSIRLVGHVAKANPQAALLGSDRELLLIFPGPHAYISPTSYDARNSVPTWDYTSVHAYGKTRRVDSADELFQMLGELTVQYEPSYQTQWNSLPDDYRDGMVRGIVGFEMTVTRMDGAFKLSQNKTDAERTRVAKKLRESNDPHGAAVADLIAKAIA